MARTTCPPSCSGELMETSAEGTHDWARELAIQVAALREELALRLSTLALALTLNASDD